MTRIRKACPEIPQNASQPLVTLPSPTQEASRSIILEEYRAMDEVLTMAQIEAKFESEWVLIEDPRTDEARKFAADWSGGTARTAKRSTAEPSKFVPNGLRSYIRAGC